ncbi:MAG: VIT1/CCC1 transporter family protein [Planctomycetes bacterium]|nr:VIT1/CCC1 transporter family protein [Planctomycetota bacterium]
MQGKSTKDLIDQHSKHAISARLSSATEHSYLGDFVLGAIDGTITTFAVVSGVTGADLQSQIALVLGLANLAADGFSMAVGNYLRVKSDRQIIERARKIEEQHIELVPEGEKEEVRQIFKRKGLDGQILEEVVKTITNNKKQWVDTMLTEELGLRVESPDPMRAAFTTFISFCIIGFVPLIPFVVMSPANHDQLFLVSSLLTGVAFFTIGFFKGKILQRSAILSAFETFFVGGAASIIAYSIGLFAKGLL